MKILEYIDNLITQKNLEVLELSKESIEKMKEELLKEPALNNCWFDNFPKNYRGIKIKIIKQGKK